jgi:hypothetical protein
LCVLRRSNGINLPSAPHRVVSLCGETSRMAGGRTIVPNVSMRRGCVLASADAIFLARPFGRVNGVQAGH